MVGATGLEPAASCQRNPRSTRPDAGLADWKSGCWGLAGTSQMAANLSPLDAGAAAASHSGRRDALQCGLGSNAAEVRRSGIASILAHGHPRRLSGLERRREPRPRASCPHLGDAVARDRMKPRLGDRLVPILVMPLLTHQPDTQTDVLPHVTGAVQAAWWTPSPTGGHGAAQARYLNPAPPADTPRCTRRERDQRPLASLPSHPTLRDGK